MAISFEDAKALLEKGQISSKTFDSITGVKWDKKSDGGLSEINPLNLTVNTIKDTVGGINDSGISKEDVSVKQSTATDQEIKKARDQTIKQTKGSEKALEDIAQKQEDIMAPYVQEQAGKLTDLQNNIQKDAEMQKLQLNQGELDLDEAHKALTEAQQKATIDPDRYMKNLNSNTGSRIMSAIGIAVSGMGAGLTGQPNMAMDILQKNVDRDIKAQQDSYLNEMNRVSKITGNSQAIINGAQTRAMANSISTVQTISAYTAGLDNIMNTITSATAKEKAQLMKQQLLQMQQTKLLEFESMFKNDITANNGFTGKLFIDMFRNGIQGRPINTQVGAKEFTQSKLPQAKPAQPAQPAQAKPAQDKPAEPKKEEPKKPSFLDSLIKGVGIAP